MTAFATEVELGEFLTAPITTGDAHALLVLEMATGAIVAELGQQIVLVDDDDIFLDGNGRDVIFLPQVPVIDIDTVNQDLTGDGTFTLVDPGDYRLESGGVLRRVKGGTGLWQMSDSDWQSGWGRRSQSWGPTWGTRAQSIEIIYSHGYATIPDAIKGVCLALAAQLWANPLAYRSEAIGNYSYSHGRVAVGSVALGDDEKRLLDPFRAPPQS